MSSSKEIMEKIIKQLKNEGVFGDLVKRAVANLEEEGFFETLREEGKERSDAIFRRYFPNREVVVDMSDRKLKEDIMSATKNYATRPELQQRIDNKLKDSFKYDWIWSLGYNRVEDKVRNELGLEPVIRPGDVKEEDMETESVEREASVERNKDRAESMDIETNEDETEEKEADSGEERSEQVEQPGEELDILL